jgi:hypothetical protein
VVGAFSYTLAKYLFFQVGLAFGANFSQANWEVMCWIQSALAQSLFHNMTLVQKQKHCITLNQISWCHSLKDKQTMAFTPAFTDARHCRVLDKSGSLSTPHTLHMSRMTSTWMSPTKLALSRQPWLESRPSSSSLGSPISPKGKIPFPGASF